LGQDEDFPSEEQKLFEIHRIEDSDSFGMSFAKSGG